MEILDIFDWIMKLGIDMYGKNLSLQAVTAKVGQVDQ